MTLVRGFDQKFKEVMRPVSWLLPIIKHTYSADSGLLIRLYESWMWGRLFYNSSTYEKLWDVTVRCRLQVVYRVTLGNLIGAYTRHATIIYKAREPCVLLLVIYWDFYYYGVLVVVTLVRGFDQKSKEVMRPFHGCCQSSGTRIPQILVYSSAYTNRGSEEGCFTNHLHMKVMRCDGPM